ncbi:MAG: hypothetical protein JJE04_06640 [Acidobacteriia bacterium]|nr:hypothetical protein [Terriglobia bacterium]
MGLSALTRMAASAACIVVVASLLAASAWAPGKHTRRFFQRGVSFTAERRIRYGSPDSIEMLKRLPAFGVDAIALIPYGFSRGNPLEIRTASTRSWESDAGIATLAAQARQLGIKVMLKPHVWRVQPEKVSSPETMRLWFAEYTRFLEHYARLAVRIDAGLFCIGVELGPLTREETQWRTLIRKVRAIYDGPLVYAANFGEEFERIRFWDALDYIGLDNYYPLTEDYSAAALVEKVETVQRRFRKPVLFTEAGFSSAEGAHKTPWADETANPVSLEEQTRCYAALLQAFYAKEWFHGVYWWKVGTNGYGGPDDNSMTPWGKPAMDVVKKYYTTGRR